MAKRMILMLVAAALLVGALGYFKLRQVQAAVKGGAFQPPPAAVTTIVAKQETWPSTLSVVGTTARASKENVRSIGYSIYYTLVNIGGAAGPYMASWVHQHMRVENVFLAAALSVFLMFFAVLLFFKDPRRSGEAQSVGAGTALRNFVTVLTNPRFMIFLLIFSGYWIVYWQEFIILPIYVHDYVNSSTNTEKMLITGPLTVIALQLLVSFLMKKMAAFRAITLGTLISALAWLILAAHPSPVMAYVTLFAVSLGEITQSPRYYEYISRLAPVGQQGTYMGFAFLPLGIGSFIAGPLGGFLLHHFGEVRHQPQRIWWVVTGIGVLTAWLLYVYDRVVKPGQAANTR